MCFKYWSVHSLSRNADGRSWYNKRIGVEREWGGVGWGGGECPSRRGTECKPILSKMRSSQPCELRWAPQ